MKALSQLLCSATAMVVLGLLAVDRASAQGLTAFPGAEGAGKFAAGGRGGRVIAVTNLNDAGPGSLRAAVEASGPRVIVFRVTGTICLKSLLKVVNPYLTISGQTAPGEGITVAGHEFRIEAGQVIVRYLRFRTGDRLRADLDAVSVRKGKRIILDHLSASWGIDEVLSVNNAYLPGPGTSPGFLPIPHSPFYALRYWTFEELSPHARGYWAGNTFNGEAWQNASGQTDPHWMVSGPQGATTAYFLNNPVSFIGTELPTVAADTSEGQVLDLAAHRCVETQ